MNKGVSGGDFSSQKIKAFSWGDVVEVVWWTVLIVYCAAVGVIVFSI